MRLGDVIRKHRELESDQTIYARKPWSSDSEVRLLQTCPPREQRDRMADEGFDYFLELSIVAEVVEGFEANCGPATEVQILERVISYAINDA